MKRHIAAWLTLTIVTAAQGAVEEPASSAKRREAAMKALAQGDAPGAERLLKENVAEAEKLGRDGLQLAGPLECLAVFYADSDRKQFDDALPLLRRALAIREQWQGCEDPEVGETLNVLGMVLIMMKKDDPLIMPLLQRARGVLENARGEDDPGVADVLHLMALRQMESREFAAAEANLERAMAIREKAFGPFSNKLANIVDDMGDLHFGRLWELELIALKTEAGKKPPEEGDSEKHDRLAHDYYSRALAIREKINKPDDDHIGGSLYNLGQLACDRGRSKEMERYLNRWLDWDRARNRRGEAKTREEVLRMLTDAAIERKDYAAAERLMSQSQENIERVYGTRSDEAAWNLTARASNALAAGRFDDAEEFLHQAFDLLSQTFCLDDPEVKAVRQFLADSYTNHVDDPLGPILWHRIDAFADKLSLEHDRLREILTSHADLLRFTSRAAPKITAEDRAYLENGPLKLYFWHRPNSGRLADQWKFEALGEPFNRTVLEESERLRNESVPVPTDEALSHMARLYDLESLELRSSVSDAGMVYLKGLINLESLTFSGSPVTDAGMVHLRGLTNLKYLSLSGSRITDAGLVHLRELTNLKDLSLSGRQITSAGIAELATLVNLESLNLAYTQVDDEALAILTALPNLRELNLEHTNITDAGLEKLHALRNLETVDVQYSRVTRPATFKLRKEWPGLRLKYQLTSPVD